MTKEQRSALRKLGEDATPGQLISKSTAVRTVAIDAAMGETK